MKETLFLLLARLLAIVRDCGSVRVSLNDSTVPANIDNIFQKAVENGRYYTGLDGVKIFNLYSRDGDSIHFMLHTCAAMSRYLGSVRVGMQILSVPRSPAAGPSYCRGCRKLVDSVLFKIALVRLAGL